MFCAIRTGQSVNSRAQRKNASGIYRKAPLKQLHTAHHRWEPVRTQVKWIRCRGARCPLRGKEAPELGTGEPRHRVRPEMDWAEQAEMDWYGVWADLNANEHGLQVFPMRSVASGGASRDARFLHRNKRFPEAHD